MISRLSDLDVKKICVIHLVWVPLGVERLKAFLDSYNRVPSGLGHDFIIVFNGFMDESELQPFYKALAGVPHERFLINKPGQDIRSYFLTARHFRYDYFFFANSYTRFLEQDWLLKLYSHFKNPEIGLVAATGSAESFYTNFLEGLEPITDTNILRRVWKKANQRVKLMKKLHRFDPFPNYHIRTNGFMIPQTVMNNIHLGALSRKTHAYMFESGKNGLTNQVLRMGLRPLVVGRDGKGFERDFWRVSGTFRQGDQGNLLIADNQTDAYATADARERAVLSQRAWGHLEIIE